MSSDFPDELRGSWHRFLLTYEPLRPELYRYCRHLTRSPWDAEDLAQDAIARAFVTLAQMGHEPPNPRAWLFRVASNLWIDRRRHEQHAARLEPPPGPEAPDPIATREAAGTLLTQLAPRERAAVVLKDVFDFSLEETAEALGTTTGAVKAALHRGRGKLVEAEPAFAEPPAPGAIEAFCAAFNEADLPRLTALLLDSASVEVVGATTLYGRERAGRNVLRGMLFGSPALANGTGVESRFVCGALPVSPRVEARAHRGEWLLLHWYEHNDGSFVRAITRVVADESGIVRLQNYFFSPDFLAEVCAELAVPFRPNGYRWTLWR
ncbi:MAG: RNA polymerase sigma factor [Labilithrix sp.]|nr:RNA polymerase sigma factor [Labilithrix sp.]MCW5811026.1 RNA polymerase sigma factor [Labilithrix sp.]